MRRCLALAAVGFALATSVSRATAAPIYFTDRNAFNAALSGALNFQSFEVAPPGPNATYSFPGFTVSETGGNNGLTSTLINGFFGNVPVTNGLGAIWYEDNGSSVGTFQFTSPINAFGVDLTTDGNSTVTVGGDVSQVLNRVANTPSFFGVFDPTGTFQTVTFDASGGPLVGFDAVSFGTAQAADAVPEPATLAVFGALAAGAFGVRRRKGKIAA